VCLINRRIIPQRSSIGKADFPRIEIIWGFSLATQKFSCIEKQVLQRNDNELWKMRQPESVLEETCTFSVALLQVSQ